MSIFKSARIRACAQQALLVFLLAGASGCGLAVSNEERLQRAVEAFDAGEYRAAFIDARNVLQEDPENVDARLLLGRAAIRVNDSETAEKELRRAMELGTPLEEVAVDLGQAMLNLGRYDELLSEIDPSVVSDRGDQIRLMQFRADATRRLQLPGSARDLYLEILALDPEDLDARLGLASAYLAQDDRARARSAIDEALQVDPNHVPALLQSAALHIRNGDFDSADRDYELALQVAERTSNDGEKILALSGLVETRLGAENVDGARQASEQLSALAPENLMARYYRARFATIDEDFEGALTSVEELLRDAPGFLPAEFLSGAIQLERGNLGQAESHLSTVLAADPGNIDARRLLAETRIRQNRAEEAAAILDPLLRSGQADQASIATAMRANLAAGDFNSVISHYQRALEANPDSIDGRLDLAAAYLTAGRIDDADAVLEGIPSDAGTSNYRRDLLRVVTPLRQNDVAGAFNQAEAMADAWPDDVRIRLMAGNLAAVLGRGDVARANFQQAKTLDPNALSSYVQLARLDVAEGNVGAAKDEFSAALEVFPEATDLMVALAQLEEFEGNRGASMSLLERAIQTDENALPARLVLAQMYLNDADYARAQQAADQIIEINENSAEAHNLRGMALQQSGMNSEAIASFAKAAELDPQSSNYRLNEIRALASAGNEQQARQRLTQVLADEPGNTDAYLLLAAIRANSGDIDGALDIARDLHARSSDGSEAFVLEGELLAQQEQFELASEAFDQAQARSPDDQGIAVRAFRIRSAGAVDDPEEPLRTYLEQQPLDNSVRLMLAQNYQSAGSAEQAIREYETVLETAPNNFAVLNNLAWLYFEANDSRAQGLAERAYDLASENGAVADTLGWIRFKNGDTEGGIDVLSKAVELSGERPEVLYHLAAALAEDARSQEARQYLERALGQGADFTSRAAAEQLLNTL